MPRAHRSVPPRPGEDAEKVPGTFDRHSVGTVIDERERGDILHFLY